MLNIKPDNSNIDIPEYVDTENIPEEEPILPNIKTEDYHFPIINIKKEDEDEDYACNPVLNEEIKLESYIEDTAVKVKLEPEEIHIFDSCEVEEKEELSECQVELQVPLTDSENDSVSSTNECLDVIEKEDSAVAEPKPKSSSSKKVSYTCSQCNYKTIRRNHFRDHELIHKNEDEVVMFKCNYCSFKSKHKRNLLTHLKNIHPTEQGDDVPATPYKCSNCPYETSNLTYMRKHRALRHDVKLLKCDKCCFKCKKEMTMSKHKESHFNVQRRFECHKCVFKTHKQKYLSKHLFTHLTEKEVEMFRCSYCTFSSKWKISIERHLQVHKKYNQIN